MIRLLRLLLFPFSLVYGLVVMARNWCYDVGLLRSTTFDVPVISIGNLDVGGTGKSPMTEYIVRLLKGHRKIAVLSRGYGRNTTGYLELGISATAAEAGDEPVQIRSKFTDITVAVCADRVEGIDRLKAGHDVILLDDAFQHRAVRPGLSILLFDYTRMDEWKCLLPAGNLREPFSGRKRADLIVVTKTPPDLTNAVQQHISAKIKPLPGQELFYSYLRYHSLIEFAGEAIMPLSSINPSETVHLLTGIGNPVPLVTELTKYTDHLVHHSYPDHHTFTRKNIAKLVSAAGGKLVITTEKDAQRLRSPNLADLLASLNLYYLPVEGKIHAAGEQRFNQLINDYVITKHL